MRLGLRRLQSCWFRREFEEQILVEILADQAGDLRRVRSGQAVIKASNRTLSWSTGPFIATAMRTGQVRPDEEQVNK
jgi:hypothetical protein